MRRIDLLIKTIKERLSVLFLIIRFFRIPLVMFILGHVYSFFNKTFKIKIIFLDFYIQNLYIILLSVIIIIIVIKIIVTYKKNNKYFSRIQLSTNKTNKQWADFKEIHIKNRIIKRIKGEIFAKNKYLRFGYKIGDNNIQVLSKSKEVLTDDNSYLVHLKRQTETSKIDLVIYKGKDKILNEENVLDKIENKFIFSISFSRRNDLTIYINKKEINTEIKVDKKLRKELYLLAWGDKHEYNILTEKLLIKLETQKQKEEKLLYIPENIILIANPHSLTTSKVIEPIYNAFVCPLEFYKEIIEDKIIENIIITLEDPQGRKQFIPTFEFNNDNYIKRNKIILYKDNIIGEFKQFTIKDQVEKKYFIFKPQYPDSLDYKWVLGTVNFIIEIKLKSKEKNVTYSKFKIELNQNIILNINKNMNQKIKVLKN